MTLADVAALQRSHATRTPDPAPAAIPVDRWMRALETDHGYVAEVAAWACARRAIATRDAGLVEALADHPNTDAFRTAVFAALHLDLKDLAPKLAARLPQLEAGPLAETLQPLEFLGVSGLRASLREKSKELIDVAEFAEWRDPALVAASQGADPALLAYVLLDKAKPGKLLDRSGGDLPWLRVLSGLVPDALPPALVDALRRRDSNATAGLMDPWLALRADDAPPALRREAAARHAVVASLASHFALVEPRREKFDAVAELAVRHGLALSGAIRFDGRGAFIRAFLGAAPIFRNPVADDPTLRAALVPLLDATTKLPGGLEPADDPAFAMAVVQAATTWGWSEFAGRVVALVGPRSPEAAMEHATLLHRIEADVLAALPPVLEPGHAGLLLNGVSAASEKLAREVVASDRVTLRSVQGVLLATFPTDEVLAAAAKVPGIVRDEVLTRFQALSMLDARWNAPESDAPLLHCASCGQLVPVTAAQVTRVGLAHWTEPPLPCPACAVVGDSTVWPPAGLEPAQQWLDAPYEAHETPRRALDRTIADGSAANLVRADILDFMGDRAQSDLAIAAAPAEEKSGDPAVYARLLLRRGRIAEALEHAQRSLDDEDADYLDARARADLLTALHKAATLLGVAVPEVRGIDAGGRTKPAGKLDVPRNAPCPCGSGKKYKRCHGA